MLIMLIMLIIWGLTGDPPPPKKNGVGKISPQMINMINISRVLATFSKKLINMINTINISPVLSTFSPRCA